MPKQMPPFKRRVRVYLNRPTLLDGDPDALLTVRYIEPAANPESSLTLILKDSNRRDLADLPINGVIFALGGTQYTVTLASGVQSTYSAFTAGLNAALNANPTLKELNAVLNPDNTITISDLAGRAFQSIGYTFVNDLLQSNGNLTFLQKVDDGRDVLERP